MADAHAPNLVCLLRGSSPGSAMPRWRAWAPLPCRDRWWPKPQLFRGFWVLLLNLGSGVSARVWEGPWTHSFQVLPVMGNAQGQSSVRSSSCAGVGAGGEKGGGPRTPRSLCRHGIPWGKLWDPLVTNSVKREQSFAIGRPFI